MKDFLPAKELFLSAKELFLIAKGVYLCVMLFYPDEIVCIYAFINLIGEKKTVCSILGMTSW